MAKKLLIVDDQPGIAKTIASIARRLGLEFRAVHDPRLAVAEFIEYQPDIVILDMIMPELDGIDVLNEIALTGQPAKIVLTSGYGNAYLALAAGVARFHGIETPPMLRKPFRSSELEALLGAAAGSC
ncbi:MAG: response regulator [Acetobacteraceae bacterium]|jgi:CheY-like chemotaxis protein